MQEKNSTEHTVPVDVADATQPAISGGKAPM